MPLLLYTSTKSEDNTMKIRCLSKWNVHTQIEQINTNLFRIDSWSGGIEFYLPSHSKKLDEHQILHSLQAHNGMQNKAFCIHNWLTTELSMRGNQKNKWQGVHLTVSVVCLFDFNEILSRRNFVHPIGQVDKWMETIGTDKWECQPMLLH